MNTIKTKNRLTKLASLVGTTAVSVLIGLPVLAQYYYPPSSFFQPAVHFFQSEEEEVDLTELLEVNDFETFTSLLDKAGLTETVNKEESLTILAPTDEAFAKLPPSIQEKLSEPENLEKVLKYHLVSGEITEADIKRREVATMLEGNYVAIAGIPNSNKAKLNDAVASNGIRARNGIIVPIDKVLLPSNF